MKLFGTDGVRGKFGYEPITPQTVLKLGWAIGTVFREQMAELGEVIIGKDTRVSGYVMESALTSGLLSSGVNIALLGPVPTPAVSYFCRSTGAMAGIVISASHNPVQDNGLKVLNSDGGKLPVAIERGIEEMMNQSIRVVSSELLGKARRIDNPVELYVGHLCAFATQPLNGLRIVVDCANGASYRIAPNVLSQLGAEVVAVADKPNGFNINLDCGSTNAEFIKSCTLKYQADVGIALDGDGDRVVMVDAEGNLVNGDQILYVIAMARKRTGILNGGVVGTQLSNMGLADALSENSIPFERVEVGDRYISKRLEERSWSLGGEECGHILNGEAGLPGDGLIAALEVLAEMISTDKSLHELTQGVKLVPQVSQNVYMKDRNAPISKLNLDQWPETSRAVDKAQAELNGNGRILLRASGTEPVIRILVEGIDRNTINQIAIQLAEVVREESGRVVSGI